jgi:hypothetical protein
METAVNTQVTKVNASFRALGFYDNVLVAYPDGKIDKFLKFIAEHQIQLPGENTPIVVPAHYRRGDKVGGKETGEFVTKNFFFNEELQGKKIRAYVTVVEKTDHYRGDKKTIILDIVPATESEAKPEWLLKIGTDDGQYPVPGTGKFVKFQDLE